MGVPDDGLFRWPPDEREPLMIGGPSVGESLMIGGPSTVMRSPMAVPRSPLPTIRTVHSAEFRRRSADSFSIAWTKFTTPPPCLSGLRFGASLTRFRSRRCLRHVRHRGCIFGRRPAFSRLYFLVLFS